MGLFDHHSSSNHTCPSHSYSTTSDEPLFGNTSFHRFAVILSGACAAFALIAALAHKELHALHYLKPNEQVKMMRVGSLITFYAFFSFLSVAFPGAYVYLKPWLDFIESFALGSFFLLLCEYVSPHAERRDVFFAAFQVPADKKTGKTPDGLSWFRARWFLVFQFPIVSLIVAILTAITQAAGVYCQWESKFYFAKLWLSIISSVSLTFAILAVLRFYVALKKEMAGYHALLKLVAFKLVVFLTFIQTIIFWILTDVHALNGNSKVTYADLNIVLPNMIICIEMVPISLLYCYAYPWTPYRKHKATVGTIADPEAPPNGYKGPQTYQGGFLGIFAWIDMFNPMETIRAIAFGIKMFSEAKSPTYRQGSSSDYDSAQDSYGYNAGYGQQQQQSRQYGNGNQGYDMSYQGGRY